MKGTGRTEGLSQVSAGCWRRLSAFLWVKKLGLSPSSRLVLKVDVGSVEVWGPETLVPAEVTGSVV